MVTELGNWVAGYQWYWIPGGNGVFQNASKPPVSSGLEIEVKYPSPFPLAFSAEDSASIAAVGLFENVYHSKSVTDPDTAQKLAQGMLTLNNNSGASIRAAYNSIQQPEWLLPGQIISVDWQYPTVSDNFTVQTISSEEQGLTVWRHSVTLANTLADTTEASILRQITQTNGRFDVVSPPLFATFEVDLTDAGQSTGLQVNRYVVPRDVRIKSWDGWFPVHPPTGRITWLISC